MAATGRRFEITEAQLLSNANFDELEVPGDYLGVLIEVDDYDSGDAEHPKPGWKWTFLVEGLPFTEWTSFATAARWKLVQLMDAYGKELKEGLNDIEPNEYIGDRVGVTVDWDPTDEKWDGIETRYKRISRFFPLVQLEDLDEVVTGTADESGMETDPVGIDVGHDETPAAEEVEIL